VHVVLYKYDADIVTRSRFVRNMQEYIIF